MICLIESQDLLGFIDGTTPAPEEKIRVSNEDSGTTEVPNRDYLVWKRSDRLLKGWILGSLNRDVLSTVMDLNTARDVWTKLETNLAPASQKHLQTANSITTIEEHKAEEDLTWYLPLYKAALRGDWKTAKSFFDLHNDAITAKITRMSDTALHLAVAKGKAIDFVEKLVQLMPTDALGMQNLDGETALHVAALLGNTKTVTILVNANPALLYIRTNRGFLPLHKASQYAHRDTILYLLGVTEKFQSITHEPSPFTGQSGAILMSNLIVSGFFDIALEVVKRYPHLATLQRENADSPLKLMAHWVSAFPSGSRHSFWESLICYCLPVKFDTSNNPNGSDVENPTDDSQGLLQMGGRIRFSGGNYFSSVCQRLNVLLWEIIGLVVPHVKLIRHEKLVHHQALQLVKGLCEEIKSLDLLTQVRWTTDPVILAARLGVHEIVEEIVDAFPNAIFSYNPDNHYPFHLAVINRCEKVFNLLYQMDEKKQFLTMTVDTFGNNILHLAGKLAPPHKLNRVSGAALQMQRELQWFKEVEKFGIPSSKEYKNNLGKTPAIVFTEEHTSLVEEGEKWMKDTATSCTIAAALIATVAFAAAITVPGGNNGSNGYPIFSGFSAFIWFAVSDAISLFTSSTSLLMFLSILTARYAEEDFLYALPKRLIIGLLTLFLSITSMMIAFSATVYLVFGQRKAWVIIPVAALACLPVTSFVFLQFPLLVAVISSTYGRGIFGKQSDRSFF